MAVELIGPVAGVMQQESPIASPALLGVIVALFVSACSATTTQEPAPIDVGTLVADGSYTTDGGVLEMHADGG